MPSPSSQRWTARASSAWLSLPEGLRVTFLLTLMFGLLLTLSGCGTTPSEPVQTSVSDAVMIEAEKPVPLEGEPTIAEALENLWANGTAWKATRDRLDAFQKWACERGFAGEAHCRRFR